MVRAGRLALVLVFAALLVGGAAVAATGEGATQSTGTWQTTSTTPTPRPASTTTCSSGSSTATAGQRTLGCRQAALGARQVVPVRAPAGGAHTATAGRPASAAPSDPAHGSTGAAVSRDLAPLLDHLPLRTSSPAGRRARKALPPVAGLLGLALIGVGWDQHRKTVHVERARQVLIARARRRSRQRTPVSYGLPAS